MLKKPKNCKIEGCSRQSFSKGLCSIHSPKKPIRADFRQGSLKQGKPLKKSGKGLKRAYLTSKRTKIKKVSEKQLQKNKKKAENTKLLHKFMYDWYVKQNPKNCWACGNPLYGEFSTGWVDHLLEKSTYPELAYEELNYFLCDLDCHNSKTQGFPKSKHKEAIIKAKERYGK